MLAEALATPKDFGGGGDRAGTAAIGMRFADAAREAVVGEDAGATAGLVGDAQQAVGGVPGVGALAIVDEVAVGIVLVAGSTRAGNLVQRIGRYAGAGIVLSQHDQVARRIVLIIGGVGTTGR